MIKALVIEPLTATELDAIRKLNAERTPGRWVLNEDADDYHPTIYDSENHNLARVRSPADAAFIAAAPEAIARLLATIDALQKQNTSDEMCPPPPHEAKQVRGRITRTYTRPELAEIEE